MPARPAEFEEKEFEAPLYNQLEFGTRLVWSPGQVFEQYVGIDRAMFLHDPEIWQSLGLPIRPRGVFLHRFDWPFWNERPRRGLPTFRLNLFIQAKRNYFHRPLPRTVKGRLSGRTCWRFDIEESQQEALGVVAEKVGDRAIVCYASPAFHRFTELNAHTQRGTIVQESTFPLATRLSGHSSFYYCSPGGSGVANPDPEEIDGLGLEEMLRRLSTSVEAQTADGNTRELQFLAGSIQNVLLESVPETNSRRALFFQRAQRCERIAEETQALGESGRAFLRIAAFASTFNLDWYVVDPRA